MRAERSGLFCRERSEFEHHRAVTGFRCVMNDSRQQRFGAAIEQSLQYESVQALATRNSNRIFYRSARKLVSKPNRLAVVPQHARADAFFERSHVRANRVVD